MAKTKILQKLRIDEVSAVRGAANPEAWVKMVKRDTPQTREQQLQNAADRYTAAVSKSAAAAPTTEFQAYQKRLYEAPTPVTEPVSAPFPAGYSKLMKMAKRLAATQPVLSVEQHFAKLCEDPRNAEHFQKAKSQPFKDTRELAPIQTNDEDEPDETDGDPDELDEDDIGGPSNLVTPTEAEARLAQPGKSTATYDTVVRT
jgi:hypothetical protein